MGERAADKLCPAAVKTLSLPTCWSTCVGVGSGQLWLHRGCTQPLEFSLGSVFPFLFFCPWGYMSRSQQGSFPTRRPLAAVSYLFRGNAINHPVPHPDSLSALVFGKLIISHVSNYPALISFCSLSRSVRQTSSNCFKVSEHPQGENLRPPGWGFWMHRTTRC